MIISKGKHAGRPRRFRGLFNKRTIEVTVTITEDWKYKTLKIENQSDINKLAGIAMLSWWKAILAIFLPASSILLIREHHRNSFRWGLTYDPPVNEHTLWAYCYVAGERLKLNLGNVKVDVPYRLRLEQRGTSLQATVLNIHDQSIRWFEIPGLTLSKFMITLGSYFGGDEPAPHDIEFPLTWNL